MPLFCYVISENIEDGNDDDDNHNGDDELYEKTSVIPWFILRAYY